MSLDLNKLANKLDEALSNETSETLNNFLKNKNMTNETKQTAVEKLITEIKKRVSIIQLEPQTMARELMIENLAMDLERFKEMEKDQIEDAWIKGNYNTDMNGNPSEHYAVSSESYYNETYGGNK
jgi:DNA topoisomerase VI subunit B